VASLPLRGLPEGSNSPVAVLRVVAFCFDDPVARRGEFVAGLDRLAARRGEFVKQRDDFITRRGEFVT